MDIIDQHNNINNNINIQYWPNGKKRNNYFTHDRAYCSRYFCTCQYRQVNTRSRWLVLELEERQYSICNELICRIIKFFTKEESEEDIKKKNKIRKDKTDELRRRYGLLED